MNAATRYITVGVQNVINEGLAAATSVNVRGTLNVNREKGKFIGSFAAYGYLKAPADHHSCRVHSAQFRDNSLCVNLLR